MPLSAPSSIAFREEEPSEGHRDGKVVDSFATISMQEEPSESHRDGKVVDSFATISMQEEPSEGRRDGKVVDSFTTISMQEEPSEGHRDDKVVDSLATISMQEEPSEGHRDGKVVDSLATISMQEEPSEGHRDDKVVDSLATISMQEEPAEEPEELHYENSIGTAPNTSTHKDDIELHVVDNIASKSEKSLPYQVEVSSTNLDRLTSTQQEEGAAALRESHPSDAAAAPMSDIYLLNPPPSRLSQRAAKAAQTPRSHTSAPITPRTRSATSTYRPPAQQQQTNEENQDAEVQSLVSGAESAPTPETAANDLSRAGAEPTPAGAAPMPTPGATSAGIPDVVVTVHKRHFPGDKWESVVPSSLDVVKRTVRNETADAIGVESQYVQVLNVEATATGITCDISVDHAPGMTANEVDEKLSRYPYETTITLPDILTAGGEHPQDDLGGALAPSEGTQAAASAHEQQVEEEGEGEAQAGVPEEAPKKMKRAHTQLENGSAASDAQKATVPPSARVLLKKLVLKGLPELLVTPRIYHYRSPRPGAERSMDKGSILYLEGPREGTGGLSSRYSTSAATPHRGTNGVTGINGSRSPSAPTYRSVSIRNSVHIPPQRVERGVVSLALRKHPIIQAAAPPQQQQRATAAPADNASAHRYMNGVDHTANTHSVSRRTRSRSPQQLALAPGTDSASDAASEEAAVTAVPMAASGSAADQDDYILMTQGVEEAADAEGLLQKKQKAVAEYDTADDEDDPVPAPAPNPFV
ncbi:conserved hypothetical protein [Leishmania major strain Friedlin]|uniref:Flagellar attachment zone protein 1 conserved domain-containing protein n=1 Tax=Leishmania major TaxID=5664 RepID=Q4Q9Y7_LEIMA|nr:conserved hypothetical protein [Leishmania major strain Friedlin]CAG9575121.1 hypothetical_protein_-_conserved [Leishmania major strain Friedlin]CAJ05133.1 conserved hypothetical protein [Leishmania major strain Friedlin]|eukprot:XP_001683861.1 conserved hypothetical protein [Leishmania major strain Friedlin]